MSSTAGDVLPAPALPPIRTTAPAPSSPPREREEDAPRSVQASSSNAPDAESSRPSAETHEAGAEEEEPTTPTWEGSRLRPPTECPPAPRKPAWAPPVAANKRKFVPTTTASPAPRRPAAAFFPVARDLSAVFRALPPKKRIRAG